MTPDTLERIAAQVRACPRCRLSESRTHAVPGEGPAGAGLMLVGEAPGATEDRTGRPFQGASGRFLDAALGELGVSRGEVFVTSPVKCRPPRNRTPRVDELNACASYLSRQIALVAPRVILAMGATAALRLHPEDLPHGVRVADLRGSPAPLGPEQALVVTFHPAAAMRFPARRAPFTDDLAMACRLAGLGDQAGS
jgi:uracil-DNA glycosylase